MTKTISLSDDAYEALAAAKRPGESFSDVARRLARLARRADLFDPGIRWPLGDEEAASRVARIRAERDRSERPPVRP